MNEKLNIQDLIDLLAEKHGLSKKDADSFVKEFFLLIEESLEKDKYVKIRGLGTFKLIDVDSRESVNVNTGERFEIQGHTKVSFTPEPILKDLVNKPFSHFETVALNDNTVLDDTPLDSESGDEFPQDIEPSQEIEEVEVPVEIPVVEQEQKSIEAIVTTNEEIVTDEEIVADEEIIAIDTKEIIEKEEKVVEEAPKDILEAEIVGNSENSADSSTMKYFIGIIVFVVVLCGGAVTFMYYPDILDNFASKPPVVEADVAKVDKTTDKTVMTDSLNIKDTAELAKTNTVAESLAVASKTKEVPKESVAQPVTPKEQKKPAAKSFEPDSIGYTIAGTETTYTIKEGETLTKVALRFYGTKALWPYIVKHNPGVIKNPDKVPFGTTIKIPKLVKKQ